MSLKKVYRTYEQICLDKLKEIGRSSVAEWSMAMGYKSSNGLIKVIKRIQKTMPEKLIIYEDRKPRLYQALPEIELYEIPPIKKKCEVR